MAGITDVNGKVRAGNGLGGKTTIVSVGVGGGAISQAQLDGIVQGITSGASLVNSNAKTDAFTVAAVGAFEAGVTTSAKLALQGTGTPNTADAGEYFAAATVAIDATFTD
jgi:hypothetical protein